MKKSKTLRLLFVLAATAVIIAATAVIASAATVSVNKNDADYKYSTTFNDGVVISFTDKGVLDNHLVSKDVYCRIELPAGFKYTGYTIYTGHIGAGTGNVPDGKCFLYNSTDEYGNEYPKGIDQKFETVGNVTYGVFRVTQQINPNRNVYKLKIKYNDTEREIPFCYLNPEPPKKMKIVTYPNKVLLNSYYVDQGKSGQFSSAEVSGVTREPVLIANGLKSAGWIKNLKPGKKYTFQFSGRARINNYDFGWPDNTMTVYGKPYIVKNVPMGPSTTPVIKSAKVSGVKVTKYFNVDEWRYKYKTKFTVTVTLSKKPSNTKGACISVGGINHTVKGTGKTFKTTYNIDSINSWKGKTAKVSVRTYSDSKYMAYSYLSKTKKVTIR